MRYDQGHISIGLVNNIGQSGTLAKGVKVYGGLSYEKNVLTDDGDGPAVISSYIFNFVQNNINQAILWAFPTISNFDFLSPLITLPDGTQITRDLLQDTGWFGEGLSNSYAPTQMYYAYYNRETTDIVYFPMNWGIISINSVHSGSKMQKINGEPTVFNKGGSSYGINQLIKGI